MRLPVLGFPKYEVDDAGQVHGPRKSPLRQNPVGSGYLSVGLYADGRPEKTRLVHHLVLEAFVGPRPDGHEASHVNGDVLDNRLENLVWETKQENMDRKVAHGRIPRGEGHFNASLTEDLVRELRLLREAGASYAELGRRFGVSRYSVRQACVRKTWNHVL